MIDLAILCEAVGCHGRVARVVVADSKGSAPREKGASMLVWEDGADGSIGGGRLEFQAMARAVDMLRNGPVSDIRRQPLGPALGQCCGGSVTLVTEIWDQAHCRKASVAVSAAEGNVFARRIEGPAEMPGRIARRVSAVSGQTQDATVELMDGWLLEPTGSRSRPVFIYGAGHVGAALARILGPLPEIEVTVADMRAQLACGLPDNVQPVFDSQPQAVMASAPADAAHFIVTHEHELDLELCHLVLGRPFSFAGLIGSATKWARFRKRLRSLGHSEAEIDRIECPIGITGFGKHPQAIAIGAAARFMHGGRRPFGYGAVE